MPFVFSSANDSHVDCVYNYPLTSQPYSGMSILAGSSAPILRISLMGQTQPSNHTVESKVVATFLERMGGFNMYFCNINVGKEFLSMSAGVHGLAEDSHSAFTGLPSTYFSN